MYIEITTDIKEIPEAFMKQAEQMGFNVQHDDSVIVLQKEMDGYMNISSILMLVDSIPYECAFVVSLMRMRRKTELHCMKYLNGGMFPVSEKHHFREHHDHSSIFDEMMELMVFKEDLENGSVEQHYAVA